MVRLQKYLAGCGIASRRQAEDLIEEGRVQVNGETAHVGDSVDPATDQVTFDGRPVVEDTKVYIILNKPKGVVTTAKDTNGRPTVLDSIGGINARVFPVGRLDMDVQGALLLTNDGELAHRLMHPSYHVDKVYLAWVHGIMSPETAVKMEWGVELEDGLTAPATVVILQTGEQDSLVRLILHEGRKREVKRMCAAVGHPVRSLQRVSIAGIHVKDLRPGEWRNLTAREVERLLRLTDMT